MTAPPHKETAMTETEKTVDLHPIFAACVGMFGGSYRTDRPFTRNGYHYATDGRLVVRCPRRDGEPELDARDTPNPSTLPWSADLYDPTPHDPPHGPDVEHECRECRGKGTRACDECEGDGVVVCEYGHYHTCPECNGDPKPHACADCDGTGVRRDPVALLVADGMYIGSNYGRLLHEHGAKLYLPRAQSPHNPLRFVIPGTDIDGLLMQRSQS